MMCDDQEACEDTNSGAKDPYDDDCTGYAANVGWCGKYDDDDFSPIRCAVYVAAVANRACHASTDSNTNGGTYVRTYDGTNASIATSV